MPTVEGNYSKADIAKKLSGATVQLTKNRLQNAIYLLIDSLGMLRQIAGHSLNAERPALPPSQSAGAAEGDHGRGFRRASIGERIALAILEIGQGYWQQATWNVKDAIEAVERLSASQNKEVKLTALPEEHDEFVGCCARHGGQYAE